MLSIISGIQVKARAGAGLAIEFKQLAGDHFILLCAREVGIKMHENQVCCILCSQSLACHS
ncbi:MULTISPECIES: hypothetical protein [unclassified Janthinobacterium]|uniref:hypothetical protein n=1 Tax=unclassified Janthinobacterium TaxID=2610881 RepID=UPI001113C540|nr:MULTISPECIES: hypothetical protein [unclassified Janthinobacterium]